MDEYSRAPFYFDAYHMDGEFPENDVLVERLQAGDSTAAPLLLSRNESYLNSFALDLCDQYGMDDFANDLKQEGALALLDAARRFDFSQDAKFTTYAWGCIKSAMLDYAAEVTLPVKLPPSRYHQLRRVKWLLSTAQPDTDEASLLRLVMGKMNVSEKVAKTLMVESSELFAGIQLGDRIFDLSCGGNPAVRHTAKLKHDHIAELLFELTPRERTLVQKYCGFGEPYGVGMTFEEIAVRLNFNSPSSAERAFQRVVTKLKELYGRVGDYGAWCEAERAFQNAKNESEKQLEDCTPQQIWWTEILHKNT